MIFVAVGTQFSFDRLIQYMDTWASKHNEDVFAQISDGDYIPKHMKWDRYLDGEQYNKHISETKSLMENKNHDYGEAWRDMRISSLTDLIIQKLLRVKQIEDNKGKTIVSEGLDANYQDMINYSIFAMIHLSENSN